MPVWHSSCMIASTGSTFHKGLNTSCVCWPSNHSQICSWIYICRWHCTSVSSLPGRSQLRSVAAGQLVVPFSKTKTLGDKGFVISGPSTWNSLSSELHDQTMSLFSFKKASENFSVSNSMSYHAMFHLPIIYLILTVNCRTVSRSVHCPFVMACH